MIRLAAGRVLLGLVAPIISVNYARFTRQREDEINRLAVIAKNYTYLSEV